MTRSRSQWIAAWFYYRSRYREALEKKRLNAARMWEKELTAAEAQLLG